MGYVNFSLLTAPEDYGQGAPRRPGVRQFLPTGRQPGGSETSRATSGYANFSLLTAPEDYGQGAPRRP